MARKKKPVFDKKLIVEAFAEMAKARSVDRDLLQGIITETFSMLVKKKYGQDAMFDIVVNMEAGDIEIYLIRTVVEEVEDPVLEISLEDLRTSGVTDYDVDDEYLEEITLDNISENFGRRLINMAGQALSQRIRDIEKENIFNQYQARVGEIIVAEIHQVRRSDVFVMHEGVELRLPRQEQIPGERYRKNDQLRAVVKEVNRQGGPSNAPEIVISRADNNFLLRLFEIEIPEIYDGLIEIKSTAREPGERAKVAVQSYDDRIDPVGACVGMKGIRIHSIVRELNNENIDVIPFSEDPSEFIKHALQPARIKDITIDAETNQASVLVGDDQVSLAIGKNGQNVRLASRLTGFSISVVREGAEDIELIEFRDELGKDLYLNLIHEEIDTAREFLEADIELLIAIKGMTKELMLEIRNIILEEFDEDEDEETVKRIKLLEEVPDELKISHLEEDTPLVGTAAELADHLTVEVSVPAAPKAEEAEQENSEDETSAPTASATEEETAATEEVEATSEEEQKDDPAE